MIPSQCLPTWHVHVVREGVSDETINIFALLLPFPFPFPLPLFHGALELTAKPNPGGGRRPFPSNPANTRGIQ